MSCLRWQRRWRSRQRWRSQDERDPRWRSKRTQRRFADHTYHSPPPFSQIPGLYTSGWLATGPTGVIATTLFNAFAAADLVAADLAALPAGEARAPLPLEQLRGGGRVVGWADWERIDALERSEGARRGKVREKMTDVRRMLEVLE